MAEENTTTSHLSVATTTKDDDTTQAASAQWWTVDKYVQLADIVIGVVGTAGNALVLYALVASKQHKKHVLIVNQNALDLFGSFFLIINYALRFANYQYFRTLGYWFCVTLVSGIFVWWGMIGSIVNLAIITIDRYLKVVHPARSNKWVRRKVLYLASAFAWFVGIVPNTALMIKTSGIRDGLCYAWILFESEVIKAISMISIFFLFYVNILIIFIFCYGHILIVIRRQAKIMASHTHSSTGATTSQSHQSHVIQKNVIKTMIIVCALYATAWLPVNIYYMMIIIDPNRTYYNYLSYAAIFIANLYTCTNPFIYAMKFDPVKRVLQNMISWRVTSSIIA